MDGSTEHPSRCVATGGMVNDPAQRLGILVKLQVVLSGEDRGLWAKIKGEGCIKMVNTLVERYLRW